jgi:ABC-2 type transport system ATP-binding protein
LKTETENIIEAVELEKKFGHFTAVNKISFEVKRGEVFGFLGANGAGKTTAIKMLIGLWAPTSGKATVAGYDLFTEAEQIRRNIGYMAQRFALYDDLSVMENIQFYGGIYGLKKNVLSERAEKLIAELGMESFRKELLKNIPLGWKQKLALSVAMIHEPKIVFLDEPTSGVDPITRRQFWDLIYKAAANGTTVFVTTHYMDESEYCDRVSIMVDGKIEALNTPAGLKKQFGVQSMDEVFLKLARPAKA